MGCDMHAFVEQNDDNGTWVRVGWPGGQDQYGAISEPFHWRNYGMYGWLADVRNYSVVPPISQPRGLPVDISEDVAQENREWDIDAHTHSWLSADELLGFDYDATFEDRRVTSCRTWADPALELEER